MKIFFAVFILFIASSFFSGCTKVGSTAPENVHQEDQNDDIFPVITITKPTDNQVYANGDSIIIEGKSTDNKVMYKGKVILKNDITGGIVAEQLFETHFLSVLNFRVAYKASVTAATDFTIAAEFQDHGLNVSTKTLKVKVNP